MASVSLFSFGKYDLQIENSQAFSSFLCRFILKRILRNPRTAYEIMKSVFGLGSGIFGLGSKMTNSKVAIFQNFAENQVE